MATASSRARRRVVYYPDSDGKPMGETPRHWKNMVDLAQTIDVYLVNNPMVFIAANMFVYYVRGNPQKHVSPDVFVVWGLPRDPDGDRRIYKLWEEKKGLDLVVEVTSKSTRQEDLETKFQLYQDVLKVKEYFLFDPYMEYLEPSLQGFRRRGSKLVRIRPEAGRLPSQLLGLHFERIGWDLRLYNPATGERLLTDREKWNQARMNQSILEHELEQLRYENEELKRRLSQRNGK